MIMLIDFCFGLTMQTSYTENHYLQRTLSHWSANRRIGISADRRSCTARQGLGYILLFAVNQ